jgi:hypothetical protein
VSDGDEIERSLLRQRLDAVRRERHNVDEARRILADMEAVYDPGAPILREGRRSVALAEQAQRLGVVDAARAGASVSELVEATRLEESVLREILDAG